MTDAPILNYGIVMAGVRDAVALVQGEPVSDEPLVLTVEDLLENNGKLSAYNDMLYAKVKRLEEEQLRSDCELLNDWENWSGPPFRERTEILRFVLNRRQIADWPAWAAEWIGGGE